MGGGSSTTRYEEWDSNRQRPYTHRRLKPGEDTTSKTLASLYTKCLSERRTPTAWKNAKMLIIFEKGNKEDHNNYRQIRLLSVIYKVLTKVLTKGLEITHDENHSESNLDSEPVTQRQITSTS